jgi:hypothetical protein
MSYIARVPVKNHIYLYECEGYREEGKVKSKRKLIGKIDPKTGRPKYKEDYIKKMKASNTPIKLDDDEKQFSVNDIKNSSLKEIGLTEIFDRLAEESGLNESIRKSNPKYCNEILVLAKHLVASGEPFMHCQEWLEKVCVTEKVGNMSSQNISAILADLTPANIEDFYHEWAKKRLEAEYLALDITST